MEGRQIFMSPTRRHVSLSFFPLETNLYQNVARLGKCFLPLGTDLYPQFARLGKCCLIPMCLTLRGETTFFSPSLRAKYIMALCFVKLNDVKIGLFIMNKRRGRKIINHHIAEGTRESHPRVHDLQHPRLGKPRRGLQIMDTRMGFPFLPL